MERTRKVDWLIAQGYRSSTLPPIVTWYRKDGTELRGRTDDYTLNLYRSKGYVLHRRFLDVQLWNELEYRGNRAGRVVAPTVDSRTTPSLVNAVRRAMGRAGFWVGTPSELLSLLGPEKRGVPKSPDALSTTLMTPQMTGALKDYGIAVERRRANGKRVVQLKSIT